MASVTAREVTCPTRAWAIREAEVPSSSAEITHAMGSDMVCYMVSYRSGRLVAATVDESRGTKAQAKHRRRLNGRLTDVTKTVEEGDGELESFNATPQGPDGDSERSTDCGASSDVGLGVLGEGGMRSRAGEGSRAGEKVEKDTNRDRKWRDSIRTSCSVYHRLGTITCHNQKSRGGNCGGSGAVAKSGEEMRS